MSGSRTIEKSGRDSSAYDPGDIKRRLLEKIHRRLKSAGLTDGCRRAEVDLPAQIDPLWMLAGRAAVRVYWQARDGAWEAAGVGAADVRRDQNGLDYSDLIRHISSNLSAKSGDARYYGGMRFDRGAARATPPWREFGTYGFVLPRFELTRGPDSNRLSCNLVPGRDHQRLGEIESSLEALQLVPAASGYTMSAVLAQINRPSKRKWEAMVSRALVDLDAAELEKIVLARRLSLQWSGPLRSHAVLKALRGYGVGCYKFWMQAPSQAAFVGASPERLYLRRGRHIESEALAGTRSRGTDQTADDQLAQELLTSAKERYEHSLVLRSVREPLTPLCRQLQGGPVGIRKVAHVQHLSTEFSGTLDEGVCDADILAALHPTAAVAGAPRSRATAMIAEIERFDRGWYAGPVGWVSADSAEFAVGIRSALVHGDRVDLYAGAGIVSGSDPVAEWEETETKMQSMIRILGRE